MIRLLVGLSLLGRMPTRIATIATGYYDNALFQTPDPDGNFALNDLPNPPSFINCSIPCETDDEHFTRDGFGNPIVTDVPEIPFTVVIPSGTPPPGGWSIVIQQHGLGGQRDTVLAFAEADATAGFASIGIDAQAHGYRFFFCAPPPRARRTPRTTSAGLPCRTASPMATWADSA